jgi:hypothetical protein
MIDGALIENLEAFMEWWKGLNPEDHVSMGEAMLVFFNLENFETTTF